MGQHYLIVNTFILYEIEEELQHIEFIWDETTTDPQWECIKYNPKEEPKYDDRWRKYN